MDLRQLQKSWDELGRRDPLWASMPYEEGLRGRWERDEFLATGVKEVDALMTYVESKGLARGRRRALDFGCGAGRLTQPLGAIFDEVHGVDIAPSMIEEAERLNSHGHRCRYHVNETDDLGLFRDNQFDLIFSMRTLQHMEPRYARKYVAELFRVLAPWGALVFQLPSEPASCSVGRLLRQIAASILPRETGERMLATKIRIADGPTLEMHTVRRDKVEAFLRTRGAELVDVVEDDTAGPQWRSLRYCVTKC